MRTGRLALTLLFLLPSVTWAADLDCRIGPVTKNYGGSSWLVYACNDEHSIVIVSAPGSKATPFFFSETWQSGGYALHGEGTGNKAATDAAFADIRKLDNGAISALVQQAHRAK